MRVCVIYPASCSASAKALAKGLSTKTNVVDAIHMVYQRDYRNYDLVINYGCSGSFYSRDRINSHVAVARCIDKIETFKRLKKAGLPILEYVTTRTKIPKEWEWVVVRESFKGNNAEGMLHVENGKEPMPMAPLYTRWFDHSREYRVVVLNGKVVGRYEKVNVNGLWHFMLVAAGGFKDIDISCIKAAEALGIDYVGFDVLAKTKKEFRICEANSGPIITPQAIEAFKKYVKERK
jgi:hypothetical protein